MQSSILIIILFVVIIVGLILWAGYTILRGIPDSVQQILERNYMIFVAFPLWSLICFSFISLAGVTTNETFEVSLWGASFKGGGGPAIVWVLATILGFLVIARYWRQQ